MRFPDAFRGRDLTITSMYLGLVKHVVCFQISSKNKEEPIGTCTIGYQAIMKCLHFRNHGLGERINNVSHVKSQPCQWEQVRCTLMKSMLNGLDNTPSEHFDVDSKGLQATSWIFYGWNVTQVLNPPRDGVYRCRHEFSSMYSFHRLLCLMPIASQLNHVIPNVAPSFHFFITHAISYHPVKVKLWMWSKYYKLIK